MGKRKHGRLEIQGKRWLIEPIGLLAESMLNDEIPPENIHRDRETDREPALILYECDGRILYKITRRLRERGAKFRLYELGIDGKIRYRELLDHLPAA